MKNIKQDLNFLNEPLWFQKVRHENFGFIWHDRDRYEYRSDYFPPDKVDILILLYLLFLAQKKGYISEINTTKYEILKGCGLPTSGSSYYQRVEESFKRWNSIDIYFNGSFYEGGQHVSIGFHILDWYEINKEKQQVSIKLNEKWLQKIKDSTFYKYLNFDYYKLLKRPISRRLFEILDKSFRNGNTCYFKLTNLGRKLTLTGSGKDGKIYASAVLTKIKSGIKEINELAASKQMTKVTGLREQDILSISYKITGEKQDRLVYFTKNPVAKHLRSQCEENAKKQDVTTDVRNGTQNDELTVLFDLLKKKTQSLKVFVTDYYNKKGFDYVRWNIVYVNKKSNKNYAPYLRKALKENWAVDWKEEQKDKTKAKNKIENREAEIKKEIEDMGGVKALFYDGLEFTILENYGLLFDDKNVLVTWQDVKLDKLAAK